MTYLSGRAKKRTTLFRYGVFVIVVAGLLMAWLSIKKIIHPVTVPILTFYAGTRESFSMFPEFFRGYLTSHTTLLKEQQDHMAKIAMLENLLAEKEGLLKEAANLALFDPSHDGTPTRITLLYPLMHDSTSLYSTILLSKGFKDGIVLDDMVYVQGKQAACTIKEVYTSSSLCLLLTASGVRTEGVTSSSSLVLSLTGRGGHFVADVIRDTQIAIGEKVYLRSDPSVSLGVVQAVIHNNQDTSWHVFVQGAYNPVQATTLYVKH